MTSIVRAAASVDDFLENSRGAWVGLDAFAYFQTTSGLTGYFLWDDPQPTELDALTRIIRASTALAMHPTLADGRGVTSPPVRLFQHMLPFYAENGSRLAQSVEKLALVRPSGIAGAAAAGFFSIVSRPYPVEIFSALEPALAWLEQEEPSELARELDALYAIARGIPALVQQLRAWLVKNLVEPRAPEIARVVGISERTLHRRLATHGTSFGDETGRARVAAAEILLRDSEIPITRIALDVGCPSLSSFSVLFRKWNGTTPSAYREAQCRPSGRSRRRSAGG